ncbi:Ribokinase-like protein [Ramaria rubella]|nr:Ribokinase-like protein [Ramaria rubella]
MFIIDEFEFRDTEGNRIDNYRSPQHLKTLGTYAAIGARIFLDSSQIGMVVDRGADFPSEILDVLLSYGKDMWLFRKREREGTTRALNKYTGQHRGFEYLTPRVRINPKDLIGFPHFSRPSQIHFICSPARAMEVVHEIKGIDSWKPLTIYEPIPERCVPEELSSLMKVLPDISILSPNAGEALALLGKFDPPTRESIQWACAQLLEFGVGATGKGYVIIRSGALGAYVKQRERSGVWVDAYWRETDQENGKIVDVTGAGNTFLGGLSAGLLLADGDVYEAALYASVASSFAIEQFGLPRLQPETGTWNGDEPMRRLRVLRERHATRTGPMSTPDA